MTTRETPHQVGARGRNARRGFHGSHLASERANKRALRPRLSLSIRAKEVVVKKEKNKQMKLSVAPRDEN